MNILTIPLMALAAFVSCLVYLHFRSEDSHELAQWLPSAAMADEHPVVHPELPHGKPAAAIALVSDAVQTLELMHSKQLDVILQSHLSEGTVDIRLQTGESLQLLSATDQWSLNAAAHPRIVLPIEVIAQREGDHHLHIFISHLADDGTQTARALAVAFKVGEPEKMKLHSKHSAPSTLYSTTTVLEAEEEIY